MENDGPVVGLDAPTGKSNVVKLDNRDRGLEAANLLFSRYSFPSDSGLLCTGEELGAELGLHPRGISETPPAPIPS